MSIVKLISTKYTKGQYGSKTVTFPFIGDVTFEQDGSLAYPSDKKESLEDFIKATQDSFAFIIEGQQQQIQIPKKTKRQIEIDAMIEQLQSLSDKEVIELAVDAGIPAQKINKSTTKKLINMMAEILVDKDDNEASTQD